MVSLKRWIAVIRLVDSRHIVPCATVQTVIHRSTIAPHIAMLQRLHVVPGPILDLYLLQTRPSTS